MNSSGSGEQTTVMTADAARVPRPAATDASADTFFQAYAQAVYAYSLRRVMAPQAAEDITAEVFLEAVRHAKRRSGAEPLPWLYGIARRKVADHMRLTARRPSESLTGAIEASAKGPHSVAEAAEQSIELRRLVDALLPDQREALLLHYVEGLSAEQVAASMRKSVPAVYSLLQRARQKLREIGAHLEFEP